MGSFLLRGIIIGLIFGIPAGAVGAMAAQRTLNYGIKAGLFTGLGSSAADCLYACVGAFGLTLISDYLLKYQNIIHLAGGCLILFMGVHMLLSKTRSSRNKSEAPGYARMFISSFAVGVTNPAAILTFVFAFSWFGITGQTELIQGIGLVCGVFLGTYIWWGTLSGAVALLKKKAALHRLQGMNRFFGVALILFGVVVLLPTACGKSPKDNETFGSTATDTEETISTVIKEISTEEILEMSPANTEDTSSGQYTESNEGTQMYTIMIEVGGQSFRAVLRDNEAARAFAGRLPMTFSMEELNSNEKYAYMEEGLPMDSQNMGSVGAGDIMLFGSDCLVLFFESFQTSYSYTPIGYIEDADSFVNALPAGTVEVTFSAVTD